MLKLPSDRRSSTAQERHQILEAYRRSGLNQRQFAAQAGVGFSTFTLWLRKAKRARKGSEPSFVELPPITSPTAALFCRLQLPGGIILDIPPGFPAGDVRELVVKFLVP